MSDLSDSRKRKITEIDFAHSAESNKRARKDPPLGSDDICNICRKDADLLYCLGPCHRAFHRSCLNLTPEHSEHYYCSECVHDTRTCFICRDTSDTCEKCCLLTCGKYYHVTCVRSNSLTKTGNESGTFICPRHVCTVCRGEGAKAGQPLLYCFDCCAAYHQSCQPDIEVLSAMYCVCAKCQRVKSDTFKSATVPAQPVTPVTATASTQYNNPMDPRLPNYTPNLLQELTNQVPVEPVSLASPVDERELPSGPALPTDKAEIERLAAMDEWDLFDLGYNETQVKELKQHASPPPSRGGFRGRGRGRGSFDGSRDAFRARNRSSREKDKPRDSRAQHPRTPDRHRSPSPPRSRRSPHSSRSWSDRRSPSPHSSHHRSPSPLRSSRSYHDRSPDRDKPRYSPHQHAPRYSPPPPPSTARTPPPPPQPSTEQSVSKVYQPLTAVPTLELTKHNKLICVMDMITVSGPKLEMPAHLELMSVVPVSIVKTIAANTSIIKTIIKLTPRPGSEAQCENLLYYLHQSGKAELFTLTTRHKVFVFSNKEDFVSDLTFKRDPVCLCGIGLYQTDLSIL